jgi:signal peptidase I
VIRGIVVVGVALVALWFAVPSTFGGCATASVVAGTSMLPTFQPGDFLLATCVGKPTTGDVVIVRPPGLTGLVVHRIVDIEGDILTTQGDNNERPDPWVLHSRNVVGRQLVAIPGAGALLRNPVMWASVLAIGVGLYFYRGFRARTT